MFLKLFFMAFIFLSSTMGRAGFSDVTFTPVTEQGIGTWQETIFGQIRVLSCSTGVKDLSMVVGGLQVRLKPDWIMKKPTLQALSEEKPYWIETPIRVGDGRNTIYEKEVFFPFAYGRDPKSMDDFYLGIQGDFPVCHKENCMTIPLKIGLLLSSQEANYTSVCSYIMEQQVQSPILGNIQGVHGFASYEEDLVRIVIDGIQKGTTAFLQTTMEEEFQVLETQIKPNGIIFYLKMPLKWEKNVKKEWIVATDRGIFRVPVQMQSKPYELPTPPVSKQFFYLTGWELFLFSPLFIWWGLGCANTNKKWKKDIIAFCLGIGVLFILCMLITYLFGQEIKPFLHSRWFGYYSVAMLCFICLFPPQKWYRALGLCLVWPYSFFLLTEIQKLSGLNLLVWIILNLFEMLIPFGVLYFKAEECGKFLRNWRKKYFFGLNLLFLVPTLFLLLKLAWIPSMISYASELNPQGISIVCAPNECLKWKGIANIHFISNKSILGNVLQNIYKQDEVILWKSNQETILLPSQISKNKLMQFIYQQEKYHASHMP